LDQEGVGVVLRSICPDCRGGSLDGFLSSFSEFQPQETYGSS